MCGLPPWARSKLDRKEINSVGKLIQKLNQLEIPSSNKRTNLSKFTRFNNNTPTNVPCPYCTTKGFKRMHLESECLTKKYDQNKGNKNNYPNRNNNPNTNNKTDRPFKVNTTKLTEIFNTESKTSNSSTH